MKQRGEFYMEVILIAVAVFAAGILIINKFVMEPEQQAEVTADQRMKIQIDALEAKLKAYEGIGKRIDAIETDSKKVWDTLDHVQNLTENADQFMKANELQIKNNQAALKTHWDAIANWQNKKTPTPEVNIDMNKLVKPLAVAIQQTRAQRPVSVNWKRHKDENGKLHWVMTDKFVEYSRAEYLKKLKKQQAKKKVKR